MATATKKTAAKATKPAAKKAVKPAAAPAKKPALKPAKPSAKKEAAASVSIDGAKAVDCLLATQTSLLNMADNIHVCLTALQSELKEARAKAAAGKKKAKK